MSSICCNQFTCGFYNLDDIDELSLNIKNVIHKLSKSEIRNLKNGYRGDKGNNLKIERLQKYYEILNRLKDQMLSGNKVCLQAQDLQLLVEKIRGIIGKNCRPEICDINIDTSQEETWAMQYAHCRSYEEWEKWTKFVCGKLKLEITREEKAKNLVFEISRSIVTPNVILALSATTEVRELNLEITRQDEELIVENTLLLEKLQNYNLSKKQYMTLVKDHNLSYDMIKTIYEAGLSIEIEEGNAYLKTYIDRYNLSEISGDIDPTYLEKFGMKATINKNDLLQDYK